MFTILFVGSNPSNASAVDAAFHGSAKSSHILSSWCKDLSGTLMYINVMNEKTENNRALKSSEIKSNLSRLSEDIAHIKPDRIVALGKTSTAALTLLQVVFYEMPHPSGNNRKLNNIPYVEEKIKRLVEFCNRTSLDFISD
jgi:uracil-DNA glycosylase